jgi:hypothetical protein
MNRIEKLKQKIGKPAIMKWAYHFALKVRSKIEGSA